MGPLGLWPTHGPDPSQPEQWFEHDDAWYLVMILPLRLPHWFVLYTAATGQPIAGAFYEILGGWVASRADPRFKLLVLRRRPPFVIGGGPTQGSGGRRGWAAIHLEVFGDETVAETRRARLLTDWTPHSFETARAISRREVRARLKTLTRGGTCCD